MVAMAEIGKAQALTGEYTQVQGAIRILDDSDGHITRIVVQAGNELPERRIASIHTMEMALPAEMKNEFRAALVVRRAAIISQLRQMGVTDLSQV